MQGPELFAVSIAAYVVIPMLLAVRQTVFQFVLLYAHLAILVGVVGLAGSTHALPSVGSIEVPAGDVALAGFLFAALVTVVVGRDLQVLRNVVVLAFCAHLVLGVVHLVNGQALASPGAVGAVPIPSVLADRPVLSVLLAGVLLAADVVLMVTLLEVCKRRLPSVAMVAVYPVALGAALVVDGLARPLVLLRLDGLADSLGSRIVLSLAFAVPVVVFVTLYRRAVLDFEHEPLTIAQLGMLSRDELLLGRATATVDRILDAAVNTMLIALDTDLRITHFNAGAEQLLEYKASEVRGATTARFVTMAEASRHADELAVTADLHSLVMATVASGRRREWELVAKSGERHIVSLSISEINVSGKVSGYLAAGEDVTNRVRSERAMMQALRREHDASLRLQEAEGVKHELVSTVSHELRTPITSISGYTELLEEGVFGELNDKQVSALQRVMRNTQRLETLVEDLLVLERAESGLLQLDRVPMDLRTIVTDIEDMLVEMVRGRDIELVARLDPDPVRVTGDQSALERVVLNLVSNAVKFTPARGRITVEVYSRDGSAGVLVSDTGVGISAEDQERLFDRFFRTHETNKKAVPGTGLGLSIVQAIVVGHDGRVTVMSAPGRGTTMAVSLPLHSSPEAAGLAGQGYRGRRALR